jgi:hypothetical protein
MMGMPLLLIQVPRVPLLRHLYTQDFETSCDQVQHGVEIHLIGHTVENRFGPDRIPDHTQIRVEQQQTLIAAESHSGRAHIL